jgi:serine/threonine protein kinase
MKVLKNGAYRIPNDTSSILGAGNFGKVYRGYDRNDEKVAIKEIPKSKLEEHPYIQEAFLSEIDTQKKATASGMPYFVKLLDNFSDDDYEYVVLEFCEGGTLTDYYKKNKLKIEEILEIIYQIGIGVEYLHRIGITHRDMKLDNVLKMGNNYKIADFGFATEKSVLATCLGTGYYMSPELVKEEEYDRRVDVWAVNTILYKMLTKTYYFDGRTRNQLDNNIINQKFRVPSRFKSSWPNEVKDLLIRGYIKDFRRRPTMLEYIEHPVFNACKGGHEKNVNMVSNMRFKKQPTLSHQPSNKTKNQHQNSESKNRQIYSQVESKMVNYINNLKKYFDLFVKIKNHDLILGLVCLKRYLQHLTLINIFFHNKTYMQTGAFKDSGITKENWKQFYQYKESKRFVIRVYYHLFVAIREYKAGWEILEGESRKKRTPNPLTIEISQMIKNSFVKGLQKLDSSLKSDTRPMMLHARQLAQKIITVEQSPGLMFQSVN